MSTTYGELVRQVMLKLSPRVDGTTKLVVEQSVNDAQKVIATAEDFDELETLDTTHAFTVASKKSYHIETDLALIRPKDIYSIRLMDSANSRKLTYVPNRLLDERVPYTELVGVGRSTYYTTRGRYVELFRIPDAVYALYIQHSQWPAILVEPEDETEYLRIDHVIVQLAADMSLSSLESGVSSPDWVARAKQLLGMSIKEEETKPDQVHTAQPFSSTAVEPMGEYWLNPWVKR